MLHELVSIMVGQQASTVSGSGHDNGVVLVSEQVFPLVGAVCDNLQLDNSMRAGSDARVMNA